MNTKNNTLKSFKELIVWKKAIDMSVEVYLLTSNFPMNEIYGITSQLRRCSNSVSLNIAEGYAKRGSKSYINHLNIAQGSLFELESGLYLSEKLNFLHKNQISILEGLIIEISKMLYSMINKLEQKYHT